MTRSPNQIDHKEEKAIEEKKVLSCDENPIYRGHKKDNTSLKMQSQLGKLTPHEEQVSLK